MAWKRSSQVEGGGEMAVYVCYCPFKLFYPPYKVQDFEGKYQKVFDVYA